MKQTTGRRDDLETYRDLKMRFDALMKELHDIHHRWLNIHDGPSPTHDAWHHELIGREVAIVGELQDLLKATDELLRGRYRRGR